MAPHRRILTSAAALALAITGVAACSPGEEAPTSSTTSSAPNDTTPPPSSTTESPSTEPTVTETVDETATEPAAPTGPTDDAPAPEDFADFTTADQTSDGWPVMSGPQTYLTQVRAAAQDGYDRVVLEFRGAEPPSYDVRYVDEATAEGSGATLDVAGTTFLRIDTAIVSNPVDLGEPENSVLTGPTDVGDAAISGLYSEGPFEGHSATHIGLDGARDFRVTTLTDPARIVVDIRR